MSYTTESSSDSSEPSTEANDKSFKATLSRSFMTLSSNTLPTGALSYALQTTLPHHNLDLNPTFLSPTVYTRPEDKPYPNGFVPAVPYNGKYAIRRREPLQPIAFTPDWVPKRDLLNIDGVPMEQCLAEVGLRDPDAPMFGYFKKKGKTTITFALTWFGYEHVDWRVDIPITRPDGTLITRGELAAALAKQYQEFTQKCDTTPYISTNECWSVGKRGFDFGQMKLVMIWNAEGDVWQAAVRIMTQ